MEQKPVRKFNLKQLKAITLTYSCHHYLLGNAPRFGDPIAWASSGNQVYAKFLQVLLKHR